MIPVIACALAILTLVSMVVLTVLIEKALAD